jgi:hypothetical protein
MAKTLAERIADIEEAIARAEESQASSVGDRTRRNPELQTLYDQYETLTLHQHFAIDGRIQAREGVD